MAQLLYTLDEARQLAVTSARVVIGRRHTNDAPVLHAMIRGEDNIQPTHPTDRRQAQRHRRILDQLSALGYGAEINDDLDGIIDALGHPDEGPLSDLSVLRRPA
jgi:hypothetical protein